MKNHCCTENSFSIDEAVAFSDMLKVNTTLTELIFGCENSIQSTNTMHVYTLFLKTGVDPNGRYSYHIDTSCAAIMKAAWGQRCGKFVP